jgi:DNA repair protein RAD50
MLLLKQLNVKWTESLSKFCVLSGLRSLTPIHSEKERENTKLEGLATTANNALQMADTMLTNLKTQTKAKKEELRGMLSVVGSLVLNPPLCCTALERKLKDGFEEDSLEAAIKEATRELNHRKTWVNVTATPLSYLRLWA